MSDLQINDLFWTLQGEGRHSGRRSLFVRLPYCNYDCPWCDTEFNSYKKWSEEDFLAFATQEKARFAVITGGEPMMNKQLPRIVKLLKDQGFEIACETNGSFPIPEGIDYVTTSPKRFTKGKFPEFYVDPQCEQRTSEWKYVVDKDFDFEILENFNTPKAGVNYSLSPEFGDMKNQVERIMAYIKDHPHWRLSLQTHKWIDIP